MEKSPNDESMRRQGHFEFFEDLDALLLEQEAENARIHEEVEKNWAADFTVTEERLIWEAFRKVFG